MSSEELFVLVVLVAMGSGVLIIVLGLRQRAHQLELAHRERMAMIDKGLVPSPELNPGHAAWANAPSRHQREMQLHDRPTLSSQRSLTLGIVIVAIGLGFMSIIGVAAQTPSVALGIGGAIAIVGMAFIVIAQVKRTAPSQMMQPPPLPASRPHASSEHPSDPAL